MPKVPVTFDPERFVAFDTETWLILPGLLAPPLVCASVAVAPDRGALLDRDQAHQAFAELLDSDWIIVGANVAYDMLVMAVDGARRGIDYMPAIWQAYDKGRVYDVQIAEALHAIANGHLGLDPRTGSALRDPVTKKPGRYSLATCVDLNLGRTNAKANDEWRIRYGELADLPVAEWPETARVYPVDDACNTLEVALAQVRHRNLHDLPAQVAKAFALHCAAAWGLRTDREATDVLEASAAVDLTVHAPYVRPTGTRDMAAIRAAVVRAYGEHAPKTEKGGIQTGRDVLLESGDEALIALAHDLEDQKTCSTYVPRLREGHDRAITLRPNTPLETGRVSYSGVWQLLPRGGGVRECVVPRPGRLFYSVDYTGGELVTFAESCVVRVGFSEMGRVLNAGQDVHAALGAVLAGVSLEEFEAKGRHKAYRQAAKPANFGFPGGMGVMKFVLQQRKGGPDTTTSDGVKYKGLRFCVLVGGRTRCGEERVTEWRDRPCPPTCHRCLEIGEEIRAAWFRRWPEARPYLDWHSRNVDTVGEVTQLYSRRVRGGADFCAEANGDFQALLADIAGRAQVRVSREQYTDRSSPLWRSRSILFAHDELFGECDEEVGHEVCARVEEIMVEEFRKGCPHHVAACRAEPTLMRRWYKQAEPVWVDGRLVPWESCDD